MADDPAFAEMVASFEDEISAKWDSAALTEEIIVSRKRPRWNHDEESGEDVIWYRGEGSYNEWAFDYMPALRPLMMARHPNITLKP